MRNYTYTYLEPRPRLRITYSGPPGLKGRSPYILGLTTGWKDIRPASHHPIEIAELNGRRLRSATVTDVAEVR
jgi:hypothetical protein